MFAILVMKDYTLILGNVKNIGSNSFKFKKVMYPVSVNVERTQDENGNDVKNFTLTSTWNGSFKSELTKEIMIDGNSITQIVPIHESDKIYDKYCVLMENSGVTDIRNKIARKDDDRNSNEKER